MHSLVMTSRSRPSPSSPSFFLDMWRKKSHLVLPFSHLCVCVLSIRRHAAEKMQDGNLGTVQVWQSPITAISMPPSVIHAAQDE